MRLFHRLRALFRKRKLDAEMDEEMRSHVEMRTEANMEAGMSPEEARRAALREFGFTESLKETCRDQRGVAGIERLLWDIRFAARMLRKHPGFAVVAGLTLALGIGANTAMFSLLNALLFRPLPCPDPDRLVRVFRTSTHSRSESLSVADFVQYRDQDRVFAHLGSFGWWGRNLTEPGQPAERLNGVSLSADVFAALGVQPELGRVFTAEEDQPGRDQEIILSHRLWKGRFAGATNIIGRVLRLDGGSVTVVGVMPPKFDFPLVWGSPAIWWPKAIRPDQLQDRTDRFDNVLGRLKPGVSLAQAQAEMSALAARFAREHPETNARSGVRLVPLAGASVPDESRRGLWFLLGLTTFVLLIACANLANLQLARITTRSRELAVRAALGAGRGRLMQQLLTESFLLSLLGGALGLWVAWWWGRLLARQLGIPDQIPLDARVVGFALGCCLLTVMASGTVPAWLAVRAGLNDKLKVNAGTTTGSRSQQRCQRALIVGEVSLAVALLASSWASIASLQGLARRDPGWRVDGLVTAAMALASYDAPEKLPAFFAQVEQRLAVMPGVESACVSTALPIWSFGNQRRIAVEGRPPPGPGEAPLAVYASVSPGYFKTLGIALRRGRTFTTADRADHPAVVIINETAARTLWPGENPIGKRIGNPGPGEPAWMEVVGVANDVSFPADPLNSEPRLQVYRPLAQDAGWGVALSLRTTGTPEATAATLRRCLSDLIHDVPVYGVQTARQAMAQTLRNFYVTTGLLGGFGLLGLILAAVGVYGVTSYSVAQRTGEIGLRLALGARQRDMLWLVLRQGLGLGLAGAVLGLGGAIVLARISAALIPVDPALGHSATIAGLEVGEWIATLGSAATLLASVLVGCYIPARRASHVDPMLALRNE